MKPGLKWLGHAVSLVLGLTFTALITPSGAVAQTRLTDSAALALAAPDPGPPWEQHIPASYLRDRERELALPEPAICVSGWGQIRPTRAVIWGAASATALYLSYHESQKVWGASSGRFHFKHDLVGDNLAMNDEFSHLFGAFQITEVLNDAYHWVGLAPDKARRIAAIETWFLTFLAEFPIDSYNPDQGFGVSDMVFNTMGVWAAARHTGQHPVPRWDVKISVKPQFYRGGSRLIAYTNDQYDDYIYWLTWRPRRNRYIPILLGAGYSTSHGNGPHIVKELHLGVGTSLEEIGGLFGDKVAGYLRPLNFFFFNIGTKIVWR